MSPSAANGRHLTLEAIPGRPAWEIAYLYPPQGDWSEADYLELSRSSNHMVEFSDGWIEVLPMLTVEHQRIVKALFKLLEAYVESGAGGEVLFAPLPVRLRAGKYREPDLIYLKPKRSRAAREFPAGADLVIEVMSEGEENRERDLKTKRKGYASAGITEYWIVDLLDERVAVLTLKGSNYKVYGDFG